ncbi:MAG: hypothetical protein IJI09_07470 [Clostridia bacterium]|nr:hypothetical protein [Clostridia bacterium]
MKKTEAEQMLVTDAELDAALAQMAEEVPPMPANFHDRWMNAVRAEAGSTAPAEEPAPKHTLSIVRWTRILSVAAVFVFLIGGTLLYRNSKKSLSSPVSFEAEKQDTVETAVEPATELAAGAVMETAEEAEEAAAEEPLMMESYMQAAAVDGAAGVPADAEAEDREALKAAGAVQNAFTAAPKEAAETDAEEADYAMEAAYEEESAMEAAAYEAAEEAAMPAQTAAPTASPTVEPTAVPTVEHEPEQTGFLPAAGAFFTDMGDFLLAALPYLLVLAVPAVTALVIRRRKNKKEN